MKQFRNIIFYTDGKAGDKPALRRGAALAIRNRGRLTVVGVLEELPRSLQMLGTAMLPKDLEAWALRDLRKRLNRFVAPVRRKCLRLGVEVLCGASFIEIIHDVLRHKRDLVMMTAEGGGMLKDLLFGSTSKRLMRKCPCPVWVIKAGPHKRFARILAAVDPDPVDAERKAVNTKILELAASLAQLERSDFHIVHAWVYPHEDRLRESRGVDVDILDEMVRNTRASHQKWLNELLKRCVPKNIRYEARLIKGAAATVIPELAAQERIDLIVMGTLARTGVAGLFIGNTAESVLHRVECSVLTVKPDGFVTPVTLGTAKAGAKSAGVRTKTRRRA